MQKNTKLFETNGVLKNMSKIAIVTDTGAYLPAELSAQYEIHEVPFQIIWDDVTYKDVIDISAEEFYNRLTTAKSMPSTSQPAPSAFEELYARLLDEGKEILSIHTSSKLSGTLDSAMQAAAVFKNAPIQLVDSLTTAMELGFHVLTAARAALAGNSLLECKAIAEKARQSSGIYFVVETLEFLRRGGRIGGGAAFLGQIIGLKPVLCVNNGLIEAAAKVRTGARAIERMLDLVEEKIKNRQPIRISAVHANASEQAQMLLEKAMWRFRQYKIVESFTSGVSPAIGVHAGPGTVGLAFQFGY